MKKILVLALIFFSTGLIFSQEAKYYDAPFGGGGGFIPGWIFPKFDKLNTQLKQFGVPEFSNSGFFTTGGGGFIYLGFIKNLRIGGMGFGGSKSVSNQGAQNKEVDYSIGGGGLTVEYTLPFVKNTGISLGAIIGGGSMQIDAYRNSGPFSWQDIWNNLSLASSSNTKRTIKNSFWFFSPTLNVDIPFYRFFIFRIGAGYQLTFGDNWTIDNDHDLSNVPSGLNGNAFFIQTGILVGFFSL
jgi:hypothetical protein